VPLDAGVWTQAELTTGGSVPEEFVSIAGESATRFWVGDSSGRLWAFFNNTWAVVYTDSSNYDLHALFLSGAGEVFAIADRQLAYCAGNCSQPGTFQVNLSVPTLSRLGAVCGGNGFAYAIVQSSSGNTVQAFRGGSWSEVASFSAPVSPATCIVLPDGTLVVMGQDDAWRRAPDAGTAIEPVPNSPRPALSPYWYGTTHHNGEVWAAGQGRRIGRRTADGTWSVVYEGTSDLYRFHAIGASGGTLVATGDESTIHTRVIVEGNTVQLAPNPSGLWGRGVFVVSPNEHVVVGFQGQAVRTGKMYRMTR
jgi:hypothetical protein